MLACNVYVDNQEIIEYPISYILKNLDFVDKFLLFGGDDTSTNILRDVTANIYNKEIINIKKKILLPNDISIAQNLCLDYTFNNVKPDFLISLQADILFNEEGIRQIKSFMKNPIYPFKYFNIEHVKMFIKCGRTNFGAVLMRGDCREKFVGDGAYLAKSGGHNDNKLIECFDIGYLSPEIWAKKLRRHGITWNSPKALDQAERCFKQRNNFIKEMSAYVKNSIGCFGLLKESEDIEWFKIIDDLNLRSGYNAVLDQIGLSFCD